MHRRLHPSRYRGPNRPVEQVDWTAAGAFCASVGMRLPTESEWVYAAAGGFDAPRYGPLDRIAWFDGNSADQTHDVATKLPTRTVSTTCSAMSGSGSPTPTLSTRSAAS